MNSDDQHTKQQALLGGSKLHQSASRRANLAEPTALNRDSAVEVTIRGTVIARYPGSDVYSIRILDTSGDVYVVDVPKDQIKLL